MTEEDAVSRAEWLLIGAEEVPDRLSQKEMEELVEFVRGNNQEAGAIAAEALNELYTNPELFESVIGELIEVSRYYPNDAEPSLAQIMSNEELKIVGFIADTLSRVAKRRPEFFTPHVDQMIEIVTSDRNWPSRHLYTLSMIYQVDPDAVPVDEIQPQLCDLLNKSWHAKWAAETLRRIGDPSALPELRKNKPDSGDSLEAFQEAIEELENSG